MTEPARISRPRGLQLAALALGVALVGLLAFWALTRDAADPLSASGPPETALRVMRLAGIERAVVGDEAGTALLRVDVPAVTSAPDVEIAYQTGFAALTVSHPEADRYVVQLFTAGQPLVELSAAGPEARAAVGADDAVQLREVIAARFIARSGEAAEPVPPPDGLDLIVPPRELDAAQSLLGSRPQGAVPVPDDALGIDLHLAGTYLDAKNRAAGLAGQGGAPSEAWTALAQATDAARRSAPPVSAPGPGESVVDRYLERLSAATYGRPFEGRDELLAEVGRLVGRGDRAAVARVRALVITAESLGQAGGVAGMLSATAEMARRVADDPLEPGPLSDAVLAAADFERAPREAHDVRSFAREPSLDVSAAEQAAGAFLPEVVLRLHARGGRPPALGWSTPEGGSTVAPEVWRAYRRDDGSLYWLAGDDGTVALTDASVSGWAFSVRRAAMVDASRCGRVEAFFAAE